MKVLVIGAGGRTGKAVVERAASAGHQVTAFVHEADEFDIADVKVIVGDATDSGAIEEAVRGQDAVLDTVGGTTPYKETTLETSVAKAANAMAFAAWLRRPCWAWAGAKRMRASMNAFWSPRSCVGPTGTKRQWRPLSRMLRSSG